MTPLRKRMLVMAAVAALAVVVAADPASAAPAAAARSMISVSSLAFVADTLDTTTADYPVVDLKWTVADSDTAAHSIRGTIELRLFNGDEAFGPPKTYTWNMQADGISDVIADHYWNTTVQQSSYTLNFIAPTYGIAEHVTWRVTKLTAVDDHNNSRSMGRDALSDFDSSVAVTEFVDTTNPELQAFGRATYQLSEVFDSGGPLALKYNVVLFEEAGFWKGKLKLKGPGGARVATSFEIVKQDQYTWMCGEGMNYDNQYVSCDVVVTLPAGSPSGVWKVANLELTDTAGNTGSYPGNEFTDIRTTRNEQLKASGFALSATQVDNWREPKNVRVTMLPSGVQGVLTKVRLESVTCYQNDTTPVTAPDGTVSVELTMSSLVTTCSVDGIALEDSRGNLALYGSRFGGSALGLVVTRIPDTVPPVALSASLRTPTVTQTELAERHGVSIDVVVDTNSPAPVNGFSTTAYNAAGISVGGASGGIGEPADGHLLLSASLGVLPVGQYTIGFTLSDAAGHSSSYGYPSGGTNPAPNGPLILTVVEG